MNFVSFDFLLFLLAVLALYFALPRKATVQNLLLLAANVVFYAWAGPQYLIYLGLSAAISYLSPILINKVKSEKAKPALKGLAVVLALAPLLVFKYAAFFMELWADLLGIFGAAASVPDLGFIAPLGISFYTFATLGYMLDCFRGSLEPEKNPLTYLLFVSFFPQLLSGPIPRAKELLPQYREARHPSFDNLWQGGSRLLLGLVKKVLVADWLAVFIDLAYGAPEAVGGGTMLLMMALYNLRIFFDFSGYTDMAVGIGQMLGITLPENFRSPFLAPDMAGFWKRWHMSLTGWLTDYIFTPLVWSRWANKVVFGKKWQEHKTVILPNIVIVFLVSGLWHGAGMTYVVWGLIHGLLRVAEELIPKKIKKKAKKGIGMHFSRLYVFITSAAAHVFFAAESLPHAFSLFKALGNPWVGTVQFLRDGLNSLVYGAPWFNNLAFGVIIIATIGVWVLDVLGDKQKAGSAASCNPLLAIKPVPRYGLCVLMLLLLLAFGQFGASSFVYFKF